MSRWLERLREISAPPTGGTDRADTTPLPSVMAVPPQGGAAVFAGAAANDEPPADLAAVAWTDADIGRFLDVQDRLLRKGWPEVEADTVAGRIVRARREVDDRRACVECRHLLRGLRCGNARAAGIGRELGRDLAELLQRCPGFADALR